MCFYIKEQRSGDINARAWEKRIIKLSARCRDEAAQSEAAREGPGERVTFLSVGKAGTLALVC